MIEKLKINMFPETSNEDTYKRERAQYIASYEVYVPGGFLSSGYYVKKPDIGEAKWNEKYPKGHSDWAVERTYLTAQGEQRLIDKINEIVEFLNNKTK